MKFDFESLSSEPLIYMLIHSGTFVCVLGFIFFVVGMLFGYATWGRYKRQTRELRGEADAMKEEIAVLKRKIGDHSIKSGAAVAMATETIHMPKKEGASAAETVPAVTEETITTREVLQPAPATAESPAKSDLPKAPANIIKVKAPSAAVPPPEPISKVEEKTDAKSPEAPPAEPAADPAMAGDLISSSELPLLPARHASPLTAIIAPPPVKEEPESSESPKAEAETAPEEAASPESGEIIPSVIELSISPLPALDFRPELDPKLGLIYKHKPEQTDDLTELKGISEALQKRLHELGVYTFAQIAAWDDDHVKEFSARLAFKDRIRREHWVEQARQLAAKHVAV
jgi:hypothetical protein